MDIKITTAGLDVVASGFINSSGDDPVRFEIPGEPLLFIQFNLKRQKGLAAKWEVADGVGHFTVTGDNLDDYGSSIPIKVATVSNREFYLSFRVNSFKDPDSFTLAYTFYLGREADEQPV